MLSRFSWIAGGRIIGAFLQLAILVILANAVDPSGFGLVSSVVALAVLPQSAFDFGISTYVIKHRAADETDGTVPYALRLSDRVSLAIGVLAAACLFILGILINPIFYWMLPLAIWVGAERNADVWLGVALADGDAYLNVLSLVGRRIVSLTVFSILLFIGVEPIFAFSLSLGIASLVAVLQVHRTIRTRLPTSAKLTFSSLMRLTWPYWLHSTATQIRNIDTAVVLIASNPVQAGLYAVASRLTGPLRILPVSLASAVLPVVSRSNGVVTRKIAIVVGSMLGVMALFYALVAYASPVVIREGLNAEYWSAIPAVQIVCLGLIFGAVASLLASILQAKGRQKNVAFASVIASTYCVPAILIGASNWGAVGAAYALISSFLLQTVLLIGAFGFRVKHR